MNMKNIKKASDLLRAIGNEKRLGILYYIRDNELSVGKIEELIDLSQSALSQHLAVLREKQIVKTRRKSQTIYYSLQDEKTEKLLSFLEQLFG